MVQDSSEVNLKILTEKKFRILLKHIQLFEEVVQRVNNSSELQVRYTSRVRTWEDGENFYSTDQSFDIKFGVDLKKWKRLSAKDRRLAYQIFLLTDHDRYTEQAVLDVLLSFTDKETRVLLPKLNVRCLISSLESLNQKQVRELVRTIGSFLPTLEEKSLTLEDLFTLRVKLIKKKEARQPVRHKGYRDHGSLGVDLPGLPTWQLEKILRKWSDIRIYKVLDIYFEDFYNDLEILSSYCDNYWRFGSN